MSKHTPGPWAAELPSESPGNRYPRGYINHDQLKSRTGTAVITLAEVGGAGEEQIANLHLIAAAPELKSAAEFARDKIEKCRGELSDWKREDLLSALGALEDALAQAEGK